ncbi:MAG: hypothetical protein CMN30_25900 [Sandaracinus sp.]|nr:hypothetical protein [Sandaracinus sp.]
MSGEPDSCSICGTAIPPGATRCPGCGAVWGDANRCPHCHATAGVKPVAGGYVCMACGKPREVKPGTTVFPGAAPFPLGKVLGGEAPPVAAEPVQAPAQDAPVASAAPVVMPTTPVAARGRAAGLRFAGIMLVAGGVLLGATAAMLLPGIAGIVGAAALGAVGVGLGGLSLRAASRQHDVADHQSHTQRELGILNLARARDGVLTVTDVASGLGISIAEADAALTAMADGSRIWAEVTPDGFVRYVFREMQTAGPRVRVDASATSEEEEALAELERELERDRNL